MNDEVIVSDPKTKIAGILTVAKWKVFENTLKCGKSDNWKQAYENYFLARIQTRYFDPIETLIKQNDKAGEGFSIVALQCSLIEFLETTLKGKNFKLCSKKHDKFNYGLGKSEKFFKEFLSSQPPFNDFFDEKSAKDFYGNVRCALLHEARTKGRWRILTGGKCDPPIDIKNKIVYRNRFQSLFIEFVEDYGKKLPHCKELQCAFIRKFDGLCVE